MNKVVLITGASSGIGKESAKLLSKEGYQIYCAARRVEEMNDLVEHGIKLLHLDLTIEKSIVDCIDAIIEKEGRIDILINNSGRADFASIEETPLDLARAQYEVNVFGLARLTQLALPLMRKNNSGKIVNISSVAGKIVTPFGGWYQSTKFAVEALSDALRMEVKQFGIDVIIIEPGAINTPIANGLGGSIRTISGNGPYKKSALNAANTLDGIFADASPPSVIAKIILKAITAGKPKTRYSVGDKARTYLLTKKILPDRAFDKMIMREYM